MFGIETEHLTLKLEVVPADVLLQHEQIIPELVERLTRDFRTQAFLRNPVIVDENHIVLDGNHRAHVFKQCGYRHILVCRLDYLNDRACTLRYWFRLIGNVQNLDLLHRIVHDMGGELHPVDGQESLRRTLAENYLYFGVQQADSCALISFPRSIVQDAVTAYEALNRLQKRLVEAGTRLEYIPCQSVQDSTFQARLGKGDMIIWTPQITKQMVVEAVKSRRVFAPKTTRHLIPARPLNVNVPIAWFKENLSLQEINRRLTAHLERKKIRHYGPGQVIDGRYYEEELYVFYDPS